MKKRNNLIALALLLASLLCLCAGCKSELDGNDGESSGMTLSQAVKYIKQATDGTIKIKVTGEMTNSDTRTLCYAINAAASGVLVELDMSEVTGLETTTEEYTINFKNCTKLVGISLPETLVVVGSEAFSGCTSLKSVVIPSSVMFIYGDSFSGCTSLKKATFADTENSWNSAKGKLVSITRSNGITEKEYEVSDSKEIGVMGKSSPASNAQVLKQAATRDRAVYNSAFFSGTTTTDGTDGTTTTPAVDTTNMTILQANGYIPTMTQSETLCIVDAKNDLLQYYLYRPITELPANIKVTLDLRQSNELTDVGLRAFGATSASRANSSLVGVMLPDSVTKIGNGAFAYNTELASVNIPSGVTEIGTEAFRGCAFSSVTIPSGVTELNMFVFADNPKLASMTIPSGVTKICRGAFYGCTSLASVEIPESVTEINENVFINCTSLTSVTIPNGVQSIGENTFQGCTSLESLTIPGGVTGIGKCAFENCTSLATITFSGTTDAWNAITKKDDWNKNVPETAVVKCTDGDVGITE